jgi:hypothetical protein
MRGLQDIAKEKEPKRTTNRGEEGQAEARAGGVDTVGEALRHDASLVGETHLQLKGNQNQSHAIKENK